MTDWTAMIQASLIERQSVLPNAGGNPRTLRFYKLLKTLNCTIDKLRERVLLSMIVSIVRSFMAEFGSKVYTSRAGEVADGCPVAVVTDRGKETDPAHTDRALSTVNELAKGYALVCELGDKCCAGVLTTSTGGGSLARADVYSVNCPGADPCPMGLPSIDAPMMPELSGPDPT